MANIFDLQHKKIKNKKPYLRASVNMDGLMELKEASQRVYEDSKEVVRVNLEISRTQRPGAQGLSQEARWFVLRGALFETNEGVQQFIQSLALVETEAAVEAGNLSQTLL